RRGARVVSDTSTAPRDRRAAAQKAAQPASTPAPILTASEPRTCGLNSPQIRCKSSLRCSDSAIATPGTTAVSATTPHDAAWAARPAANTDGDGPTVISSADPALRTASPHSAAVARAHASSGKDADTAAAARAGWSSLRNPPPCKPAAAIG